MSLSFRSRFRSSQPRLRPVPRLRPKLLRLGPSFEPTSISKLVWRPHVPSSRVEHARRVTRAAPAQLLAQTWRPHVPSSRSARSGLFGPSSKVTRAAPPSSWHLLHSSGFGGRTRAAPPSFEYFILAFHPSTPSVLISLVWPAPAPSERSERGLQAAALPCAHRLGLGLDLDAFGVGLGVCSGLRRRVRAAGAGGGFVRAAGAAGCAAGVFKGRQKGLILGPAAPRRRLLRLELPRACGAGFHEIVAGVLYARRGLRKEVGACARRGLRKEVAVWVFNA